MPALSTSEITPERKLFHNEWINVYPTRLPLEKIHFWKENNRTIFTLERLVREKGVSLDKIDIDEITRFVAEQDIHKLQLLADSIGRNGVQVPLVISDAGKLLDGNRRYFACEWLKMQCIERKEKVPESLSQIPAHIIRERDLNPTLELKILAEANFIRDLKEPWPLDAQARAVHQYYAQMLKEKKGHPDEALAEVVGVFGITKQRANDLLDTLALTEEFISQGGDGDGRMARRAIVEEKFVYLWEFRNKATKGRGVLAETDLPEVKELFFDFMARGRDNPIKNVKQIEPLVHAYHDHPAWRMLKGSGGTKLAAVVSLMNEKKEVKKSEDKIRLFIMWMEGISKFTATAKARLRELAKLAIEKARE